MLRLAGFSQLKAWNIIAHCEQKSNESDARSLENARLPTRTQGLQRLKSTKEYDVLVIGGGATGCGAALDAAKRGMSIACIEKEDFSSATSSRSTKLLWGGSRYLVQAFVALLNPDLRLLRSPKETVGTFIKEFKMVMNCHRERKFLLLNQPHLTYWMPIAVPLKEWLLWPPPFNFPPAAVGPLGLFPFFFKFYDALSGFSCPPSHIMSPDRARRKFPQLANNDIKYCSVFYEGMHDDARTNLAIAQTAALEGADMLNYCEAVGFIHDDSGITELDKKKVVGVIVRDTISGETFEVRAKSILLCGGPFTDNMRKLENENATPAVTGAAGIHIVLPSYYAPSIGLVDMNTSDGRFMFFLPWNDHVIIGTTDHKCQPDFRPVPSEAEIKWLLNEASKYLNPELRLRRKDVLSAWSGIRPLATDPNAKSTSSTSRDHVISHDTHTGITFISGGKWTTFREMAEDALDRVIEENPILAGNRSIKPCSTLDSRFIGYEGWSSNLHIRLIQKYEINPSIAKRLADAYGGRAHDVISIAKSLGADGLERTLVPNFPILDAEVIFAARHEWAVHPEDVLARRTRLAFVNKAAAVSAIPKVVELMGNELKWTSKQRQSEIQRCVEYMRTFGGPTPLGEATVRMATYTDLKHAFREVDTEKTGFLTKSQIPLVAEILHHPLSEEELSDLLKFAVGQGISSDKLPLSALCEWWNSDRFNPGLVELRKNKMATANQLEGAGAFFG